MFTPHGVSPHRFAPLLDDYGRFPRSALHESVRVCREEAERHLRPDRQPPAFAARKPEARLTGHPVLVDDRLRSDVPEHVRRVNRPFRPASPPPCRAERRTVSPESRAQVASMLSGIDGVVVPHVRHGKRLRILDQFLRPVVRIPVRHRGIGQADRERELNKRQQGKNSSKRHGLHFSSLYF